MIRLAILWHMHQPDYRLPGRGRFASMPWVRLHAAKDYVDMPLLAARHPRIRTTFNLVPVLIEQVEDVALGGSDPLLELSLRHPAELRPADREALIEPMFRLPVQTMIQPLPRYAELRGRARTWEDGGTSSAAAFTTQELLDLIVLFHLAWTGPLLRREPMMQELLSKGRGFTTGDRDSLLARHRERAGELVPVLRDLQDRGRIELSTTPFCHPILPLLCDSDAAAVARTGCVPPSPAFRWPGDARLQVREGLNLMEARFGRRPQGLWPSEGSVSPAAVEALSGLGLRWIATDVQILRKTIPAAGPQAHLTPWRLPDGLSIFFRDTDLSDRIGFRYAQRAPKEAVADFLGRIRDLARGWKGPGVPVVPVVLDGENAWEHYPGQGEPFLDALYTALAQASDIETVTLTEALDGCEAPPALSSVGTGSWIRGDLDTWAGHPEKNRAWSLLTEVRAAFGRWEVGNPDPGRMRIVRRRLHAAEGSDWFWWLGDDHPTPYLAWFDACFRAHLRAVWAGMDLSPPRNLDEPVVRRGGVADPRWRPPTGPIDPPLRADGWPVTEWVGAGTWTAGTAGGAMRSGSRPSLLLLRLGVGRGYLSCCLEPQQGTIDEIVQSCRLTLDLGGLRVAAGLALPEGLQQALGRAWVVRIPVDLLPSGWAAQACSVRLVAGEAEEHLEVPPWALADLLGVPDSDWSA